MGGRAVGRPTVTQVGWNADCSASPAQGESSPLVRHQTAGGVDSPLSLDQRRGECELVEENRILRGSVTRRCRSSSCRCRPGPVRSWEGSDHMRARAQLLTAGRRRTSLRVSRCGACRGLGSRRPGGPPRRCQAPGVRCSRPLLSSADAALLPPFMSSLAAAADIRSSPGYKTPPPSPGLTTTLKKPAMTESHLHDSLVGQLGGLRHGAFIAAGVSRIVDFSRSLCAEFLSFPDTKIVSVSIKRNTI